MKPLIRSAVAVASVVSSIGLMSGTAQAALLAYWNFGNSIAQDAVVAAPYGPTVVASGVSVSSMQFESGWLVITNQVNRQLGSTSLTIGSQTFNSDSTGTYAAVTDDNFTRSRFIVTNEGDNRNNTNPGKGMLQLLTPGSNISNIQESRDRNLGFGLTVTASDSILELTSLVLQAARNNANPERSFETIALYADTGSGQFLVGTQGPTPIAGALAPVTFDLSSLGVLANSSSVTFRLYGDNGVNGDSTFGRELFIDDITLNGFTSPIPEPAGMLAVVVMGAGLLIRRRGSRAL